MQHIALYRKYRSATFDDVCGQDQVTKILKYQAMSGRVSHAYLFCGSRGTGKTSCAKILAKAVNCEDPKDGNPCGVCESCRSIDRSSATDVVEMDAASETGVDYIRRIKEEVLYPPALLKKRVYIIDEVHMLSESAFNALLKTLEEPPSHVIFILATTELHKLPATVVSRCQRFDFKRLPTEIICDRLKYIAKEEKIPLEDAAATLIARQSAGGMRDAISLFELCSGGGAEVTEERAKEILGVSGYETVAETARAIADKDVPKLFSVVDSVVGSSKDISVFWQELTYFYRDMLVAKYAKDPKSYLDLTESDFSLLRDCASRFKLARLYYQSKVLETAQRDMRLMPQNKRQTAEFALIRMCEESLDLSNDALLSRIEALESVINGTGFSEVQPVSAKDADNAPEKPVEKKVGIVEPTPEQTEKKGISVPENDKTAALPAAQQKRTEIGSEGFKKIPDLTEVATEVGKSDFLLRSLLAEATGYLSDDGTEVKLVTENVFAKTYIVSERARLIALALMKLGINDREAKVTVAVKSEKTSHLYDELFKENI
ncbi:MAG: DNA polymerase III subunit gamma/tau [Clostridia bacterium]|nr:DNA polymerase III subunit gamma/tau [Clostridia bacterium]